MDPFNKLNLHLTVTITTRLIACIVLLLSFSTTYGTSNETIDDYVQQVMATFHVPGVSVGVVKDGSIVHMQGYGIADIETGQKVDEFTIFKIASNTKAFTATALATLVEQGKMEWTDKVNQHLPDFKMYDQYASQEFNIIDLLTHRSGLGLGSGDLMLWPEPTKFTREQLVKNLRYLKPAYGFREKYAYDNTLYIVAGEVAASIAGTSWEEYIEQSILKPLGMKNCYAGGIDTKKIKNVVAPHLYMNGQSIVDQPNRIRKNSTLMAAAGGIKCSLHDLMTWVDLQLRHGVTKDGTRLVSEEQARKMWYPVTPLRVSKSARELDNTNFRGYALGWRVNDYRGQWMVSHTGTLSGAMSQIVLLPDSNLAIVVMINQSSGYARNALSRGITNYFLGEDPQQSLLRNVERQKERQAWLQTEEAKEQGMVLPPETQISKKMARGRLGNYVDPWFGKISMTREGDDVVFQADNVPRMVGKVYAYDKDTWWVKWDNRSFEADSWIRFEKNARKLNMTMERIAEDSDWSMSVQDLFFTKKR